MSKICFGLEEDNTVYMGEMRRVDRLLGSRSAMPKFVQKQVQV